MQDKIIYKIITFILTIVFSITHKGHAELLPLMHFFDQSQVAYILVDMQGGDTQLPGSSQLWKRHRKVVQYAFSHNSTVVCVLQGITFRGQRTATNCNKNIIHPEEKNNPKFIEHIKTQNIDAVDFSNPQEYLLETRRSSYPKSSFEDGVLHQRLEDKGIKTLVVMGAYTHLCVRETIIDALSLGYKVILDQSLVTCVRPNSALGSNGHLYEYYEFQQTIQHIENSGYLQNLTVIDNTCAPSRKQPLFRLEIIQNNWFANMFGLLKL